MIPWPGDYLTARSSTCAGAAQGSHSWPHARALFTADEIDEQVQGHSRGFGSVPVEVRGTGVAWRTSLFPDRKSGTFILPLKKQIRQQLDCAEGSSVTLTIKVLDE